MDIREKETRQGAGATQNISQAVGSVLLVEDEEINQIVAVAILEKFGLKVDVVASGVEALNRIRENVYGLILMDIQIPEIDGFGVTKMIRQFEQDNKKERVPIIAMTAHSSETIRQSCFAAGMDDFLIKPLEPQMIVTLLSLYLENMSRWKPKKGIGRGLLSLVETSDKELWSRKRALEYVGGDEELFSELARVFITTYSTLLANMVLAVEQEDMLRLRDAAHTFKGGVSHFSAPSLQKMAEHLETLGQGGGMDGAELLLKEISGQTKMLVDHLRLMVNEKE